MKITLGEERVIVRGIRPEQQLWGPYQFPRPYDLGDRLVVAVHVASDDIKSFGTDNRWFESRDRGATWQEIGPEVSVECGLKLQNGDKIYFPMESGISLKNYRMTEQKYRTPGYDYSKQAEEGTLPIPDGMTFWMDGTTIRAYRADRLPPSLAGSKWLMKRLKAGESQPTTEYAQVDWPCLTRVVFSGPNYDNVLKPMFPRGTPKLGPDGAIWVSVFSGEGHINPDNGWYSPYYSAELFRSEDFGRTFTRRAHGVSGRRAQVSVRKRRLQRFRLRVHARRFDGVVHALQLVWQYGRGVESDVHDALDRRRLYVVGAGALFGHGHIAAAGYTGVRRDADLLCAPRDVRARVHRRQRA